MINRDAGYSGHIGRVHYGVNAQYRTGGHFRKADKRVSVALSVPLDFAGQQARSHFHYHQRAGKASLQTSVNGLLGDEQRLGYSVTHSYQQQGLHITAGRSCAGVTTWPISRDVLITVRDTIP